MRGNGYIGMGHVPAPGHHNRALLNRPGWTVSGAVLCCAFPAHAHAHLVSTGFGAYYDGIAHLAMTPADLLVIGALALVAARDGAAAGRLLLYTVPVGWLAGGLLGLNLPGAGHMPVASVLPFLLIGLLVALDARPGPAALVLLGTGAGVVHGCANGAALAGAGAGPLMLAGSVTAVFVLGALLPALLIGMRVHWMGVAVRVVGSQIAAIGVLMIGWFWTGAGA